MGKCKTTLTGRSSGRYLRSRSYGEVEIRRNASGDFIVYHREIPEQAQDKGPWLKGHAFSETTPMRDIDDYAETVLRDYKNKRAVRGGGIDV